LNSLHGREVEERTEKVRERKERLLQPCTGKERTTICSWCLDPSCRSFAEEERITSLLVVVVVRSEMIGEDGGCRDISEREIVSCREIVAGRKDGGRSCGERDGCESVTEEGKKKGREKK